MNENEEDYVSFRVARLLKGKGFREDVSAIFECNACKVYFRTVRWPDNYNDEEGNHTYVSAPTLWQVTKWLREEKKLHVLVDSDVDSTWWYKVFRVGGLCVHEGNSGFPTYESALDAGIEAALRLI